MGGGEVSSPTPVAHGNVEVVEADATGAVGLNEQQQATTSTPNEDGPVSSSTSAGPKIKVLSFDLDDTIFECWPVLNRAAKAQYDYLEFSFPTLAEQVPLNRFKELFKEVMSENEDKKHDLTYIRKKTLARAAEISGHDPEQVVEPAFEAFIRARNDVESHIFPGVLDALMRFKAQGYRLVTLTNGNCDVSAVRAFVEPESIFDFSVTAESAGAAKPDARPFQEIMNLTGVSHPSEILHIGDSISSDVEGAREFGMRTVWVNREGVDLEHNADHVVRCVSEIDEAVLDKIHSILHAPKDTIVPTNISP